MKNVQESGVSVKSIKTQVLQNVCEKRTFTAHLAGESGTLVILIHGFPDNYLTFREQVPALVAAGYRVLMPVLPGYEVSSVDPAGHYHLSDLVPWLISWMDKLQVEKAHLVGHDWGAGIATLAAAAHPERFYSLTSIAIPSLSRMPKAVRRYPGQFLNSWYMFFFQLRGVAERAINYKAGWLIRRLWRDWSPDLQNEQQHIDGVCQLLIQPEVQKAALGYYRCLFKVWEESHADGRELMLNTIKVPTLLITGANDGCIDTRLFDESLVESDYPAGVELYRLMGAGHFCHLEKPALVNERLLQFFQQSLPVSSSVSELSGQLG